jgi:pyruvate kinase
LALLWGVTPFLATSEGNPDEILDRAVRQATSHGIVKNGDLLVIVSVTSQPVGVVTRASNLLRIAHVRQRGNGG